MSQPVPREQYDHRRKQTAEMPQPQFPYHGTFPHLNQYQPGTFVAVDGWNAAHPFNPSLASSFVAAPSCTKCFTLGCELHHSRSLAQEVVMMLNKKGMELETCREELAVLSDKNKAMVEEIKNLQKKVDSVQSYASEIEKKYQTLEEDRDRLQQLINDKSSSISAERSTDSDAQTDSEASEGSWRQESSDRRKWEPQGNQQSNEGKPPEYQEYDERHGEGTKARYRQQPQDTYSQKGGQGDRSLRNQDIRPQRPQNRSGLAENVVHPGANNRVWHSKGSDATKTTGNRGVSYDEHDQHHHEGSNSSHWQRPQETPSQRDQGDRGWRNREVRPSKPSYRSDAAESVVQRGAGHRSGPNQHMQSARPSNYSDSTERSDQQYSAERKEAMDVRSQARSLTSCVLKEIKSDLFDMPPEYALAHCVGSDFIMSSGIAVKFRKKFRCVPELLDQNKIPGQVAYLERSGQYIYYLVTKVASTIKPQWEDFESSVIEWSKLCLQHGVKKIAIPKLGCGRDRLDWERVQNLLIKQFSNKGVEIVVCVVDRESTPEKKWNLKLCHNKDPLSQLDPNECALVFIASKDGKMTRSIEKLATKYGFSSSYSSHTLSLGSLYQYHNKACRVNVFGLVVKEKFDDPISYTAISQCLQSLKRAMKKSELWYMGFEAFDDPRVPLATRKLWTVIIDVFFLDEFEVHFCWPDYVTEKCWDEQRS